MASADDLDFSRHANELRAKLGRVGVWWTAAALGAADDTRRIVAEIEQLGYSTFWYGESAIAKDTFAQAAIVLSATSTLNVATGIANVWSRAAVTAVAGAAALGEAFDDRFLLGLGISHAPQISLVGGDDAKPLTTMRRYLDAMDEAPYAGARPAAGVRRVLAALRPGMTTLAGERSAGAHPYFVPVEHTVRAREALGLQPLLAPEQAFVLQTDPDLARATARAHMAPTLAMPNYANHLRALGYGDEDLAGGGSDRLVDAIVAWGDVDAVAARVRAHLDAGADHVAVQPLGDLESATAMLRTIAPTLTTL